VTKPDMLGEALGAVNPDDLSPKEALELVYRLKLLATQR
jgi:DNA mismatch repair protein MutS